MTITEMWNSVETNPFTEVANTLSGKEGYDFITEGSETINDTLLIFYGDRELFNDDVSYNKTCISCLLRMNRYKYDTLFNTMFFDYNPIENYSMVEETEVEKEGNNISTSKNNSQTETENTLTYGEISETATNNIGARTLNETRDDSKYAFNSGRESPFTTTNNSVEEGAKTDTITNKRNSVIDKNVANTEVGSSAETAGNQHETAKKTLTRSGNVGVTTSQEMIQSERDLAMFSFYKEIAHDIVRTISWGVY